MARQDPNQPSARTFLIRRIVVLAALLLVIGLLWAGVSAVVGWVGGLFGGAKPAATASVSQTPGVPGPCRSADISVLAVVGDGSKPQSVFASGTNPKLWFTITNTSSVACNFALGTDVQDYKITSGAETIWDNANCLGSTSPYTALLQPGVATPAPTITWERVHSSSTGCDQATKQGAATGGGASYHLVVTVNGVKSNDVQFILN
mgnify:CR=1 FL=1